MENKFEDTNEGRWIDRHLAALTPPATWQPNGREAFDRVAERFSRKSRRGSLLMAAAMVVFLGAIVGLLPWKFFWNPSQAGSTAGEITGSITNEAAMAAGSPQLIVPTVRIPEVPAAEPPRIPVVQPAENPGLSPPRQKKFPRAENYHVEEPAPTKLSMFLNEGELPKASEPRLRSRVDPVYTQEARDAKLQGTVELRCLVLADGSVEVQEITQSLGHGLDEAAIAAVSQYRFEPARRDGQPVPVYVNMRLNFTLR